MFLIITNSIILGIQGGKLCENQGTWIDVPKARPDIATSISEISHMKGTTIGWVKVLLNVFDYITLVVFVMEIIIKWVDGFWVFWKNGWNNFDFFVTAMVRFKLHYRCIQFKSSYPCNHH
jgi:hypothetical protein